MRCRIAYFRFAGDAYTVYEFGTVCFTEVVLLVNIRIALSMHFHHWFFQVRVYQHLML